MAIIVVERSFDRPRDIAELPVLTKSTEWCMALHGVAALRHYLAFDGRRLDCVFDAPDVEALRATIRTAGLSPPGDVWSASIHPGAGHGPEDSPDPAAGTLVVVERSFRSPVAFDDVQALEKASHHCFDLRGVTFLRSYFSANRRRMLCLYLAPDAEAVRAANQTGGLPFDLAWPARMIVETTRPPTSAASGSG